MYWEKEKEIRPRYKVENLQLESLNNSLTDNLVRMHGFSGTTDKSTLIFHTPADIESWSNLAARCIYMAGVRKSDVSQNMMNSGLFMWGALRLRSLR